MASWCKKIGESTKFFGYSSEFPGPHPTSSTTEKDECILILIDDLILWITIFPSPDVFWETYQKLADARKGVISKKLRS